RVRVSGVVVLDEDGGRRVLHSFPTRRSSDLTADPRGTDEGDQSAEERLPHPEDGPFAGGSATFLADLQPDGRRAGRGAARAPQIDRKSTRLNSSHVKISYAVFCLKKKKIAAA